MRLRACWQRDAAEVLEGMAHLARGADFAVASTGEAPRLATSAPRWRPMTC